MDNQLITTRESLEAQKTIDRVKEINLELTRIDFDLGQLSYTKDIHNQDKPTISVCIHDDANALGILVSIDFTVKVVSLIEEHLSLKRQKLMQEAQRLMR